MSSFIACKVNENKSVDLIDGMCFVIFKDSGFDFKRSELLYFFIQNLAGVIKSALKIVNKRI